MINVAQIILWVLVAWFLLRLFKGAPAGSSECDWRRPGPAAKGCWPYPEGTTDPRYLHPWWAQYRDGWSHAYMKDGVWHPYRYSYWW